MTREELIDHLEHLERYTHYSEDAPALREVIEMLKCSEMPNGSDAVSRQAAIDTLFSEPLYESGMKKRDADAVVPAIYEKIKSLSPVQPEQRWIPCSERLPEEIEKSYWVCTDSGYQCSCKWKKYLGKGKDIWTWHLNAYVVAWMPLPEPYREEE